MVLILSQPQAKHTIVNDILESVFPVKGCLTLTKIGVQICRKKIISMALSDNVSLKAYCRGADWINETIKKKRIKQGSVISLYSEIHGDDNDLIPFILERKYDPRA